MKKIALTQGKFALVDDEDYAELNKNKWAGGKAGNSFYARRSVTVGGKKKTLRLHREILKPPEGMEVDHIDGDGLNNQRSNIRICTHAQNSMNQHSIYGVCKYKGVTWLPRASRWIARISINGKLTYIKSFTCLVKAARAYDVMAKKHYGEFACLNFPEDE